MFRNNTIFVVKSTISSTQWVWTTFKISEDFETKTHIETWSNNVSIKLENATQIERMVVTMTWWVATIVQRWIKQDDVIVTDVTYQKQWNDSTIWCITSFASDLLDIDNNWVRQVIKSDLWILTGKKLYLWDNAYVTTSNNWTDLKFKDWNNAEVSLSTLNAWAGTDHKVLTSNLDTIAWYLTEKLTAWDWLNKTIINPWANESIDLDIDLTDTTIFSDVWVASKAVKTDSNGNLFQATETQRGWVERATDAEALAWVDTTRYITPKQARDNYWNKLVTVSNNILASSDTEWSFIWTTNRKVKEIRVNINWNYRVSFEIKRTWGSWNAVTWVIYKNGISIWTPAVLNSTTYTAFSQDFNFVIWDYVQLYMSSSDPDQTNWYRNFQIKWDINYLSNFEVIL